MQSDCLYKIQIYMKLNSRDFRAISGKIGAQCSYQQQHKQIDENTKKLLSKKRFRLYIINVILLSIQLKYQN